MKMKRLNEEAHKLVDEKAKSIVDALYKSTEKGGVMCARLLIELAEGGVEAEEAARRQPLPSLAEALAADELWVWPTETGSGGREPE
jgi:hypothetical protein